MYNISTTINHFMVINPDTTKNQIFKTKIIARKTLPLPSNMHNTMGLVSTVFGLWKFCLRLVWSSLDGC